MHAYCQQPCIVLCGNKSDMDSNRVIIETKAKELATKYGFPYIETSAKTGHNVQRAFDILVDVVMKKMENAIDKSLSCGRSGKPKTSESADIAEIQKKSCVC